MEEFFEEENEGKVFKVTIIPDEVLEGRSYTQEYFGEIFRIRQSFFVYLLCLPQEEFDYAYDKIKNDPTYLGIEIANYYFVVNKLEMSLGDYMVCQNNIKTAWDLIDQVKKRRIRI